MNDDIINLNIQLSHDEMRTLAAAIATYGTSLDQMMKADMKPNDPRVTLVKEAKSAVGSIEGKFREFMEQNNFEMAMIYTSIDA